MENMWFGSFMVQMGNCRPERVGCLPQATGPSSERQSRGWSLGPVPQAACPSHCPGPAPILASLRSACLVGPELTSLLLQLCFLKPLFENSFPCQEPQALGAVKSNLMEHEEAIYREAREMGPDSGAVVKLRWAGH